jgi:ATP-dependent HslUV protease subunit HslV
MMAVADDTVSLIVSGTGDVLEPEDGLIGIGSGGNYALSAARAMIDRDDMTAEMVAKRAIEIAADICVYTNKNIITEKIKNK